MKTTVDSEAGPSHSGDAIRVAVTGRCLRCQPCKDWMKQKAAHSAAISEATLLPRERLSLSEIDQRKADAKVVDLRASWNAMQEDPDFKCEVSRGPATGS